MIKKIHLIFGKLGKVLGQYPMVLLCSFLASVSAVMGIERDGTDDVQLVLVIFTLVSCLGISLFFALNILSQRIGKSFLLNSLGTAFLVAFFNILPANNRDFTEIYGILLAVTFILSHLLVSFVAFLNEESDEKFWHYNKNLFINIVLTAIFTGVLVGGIELAVLAVNKLFDFNFDNNIFPELFFALAIFGSSVIFLLFNEEGLRFLEKDNGYPEVLKFFTQFILIPLLLVYSVIFYFYLGKIIINWELPKGWISYLVLAYSIVGILALLLVYPLKVGSTKSWVKIFSKIFYYTLIPLIVLLFVAIFTRILQYGFTEPRYYVLLVAIWLTVVVLYFIFWRKSSIKFIPLSLFLFGLFSLVFPYLNAFSASKNSQKIEFVKILKENNLIEKGKINFKKHISSEIAEEIADKAAFLAIRNESALVYSVSGQQADKSLNESIKNKRENDIKVAFRELFTNSEITLKPASSERIELTSKNPVKNISDYDYLVNLSATSSNSFNINGDQFETVQKLNRKNPQFQVVLNKNKSVDFGNELTKIFNVNLRESNSFPEISVQGELGDYRFKIVFDDLTKQKFLKSENIYYSKAILLIKKK